MQQEINLVLELLLSKSIFQRFRKNMVSKLCLSNRTFSSNFDKVKNPKTWCEIKF